MDDFGDFLAGLRGQIERCAAEAAPGRGKETATRSRSNKRTAAVLAACLAAAAIALAVFVWYPGRGTVPTARSGSTAAIMLAPMTHSLSSSSAPLRDRGELFAPAALAAPEPGYHLLDVAARAQDDIWAVGFLSTVTSAGETIHSLVLHWDGRAWRQVRTPEVGAVRTIAVDAEGGAWALAWGSRSEARQHMLHWDGHAWTDSILPADAGLMADVCAIAPDDVWAAGAKTDPMVTRGKYSWNPEHVRLSHWDGTAWTTVAAPAGARRGFLTSVSGTGPADVWAVGRRDPPGGKSAGPLALHWDGTAWTRVPGILGGAPWLVTVAALSPTDVWTGGEKLLERWDGSVWRLESHDFSIYSQLSGLSPTSMWLALQNRGVVTWDGRGWRSFSLHNMGVTSAGTRATVNAVAAQSAPDVWAVGQNLESQSPVRQLVGAGDAAHRPLGRQPLAHRRGLGVVALADAASRRERRRTEMTDAEGTFMKGRITHLAAQLLGVVAVALIVALPLTGCGGEAEAIGVPSPTATPAPAWLVREAALQAAQWGDAHPATAYWGLLRDPERAARDSGPDDPSHALYVIVLVGDYSKAYASVSFPGPPPSPLPPIKWIMRTYTEARADAGISGSRHQEIRRRAVSEPSSPAPEWLRR